MRKYKCTVCGYIYDEAAGIPENGIAPGTKWEDLPDGFACPICTAPKSVFVLLAEPSPAPTVNPHADGHMEELRALTAGEISAICSSLAKGCDMQRLTEETAAFKKLADYYKSKADAEPGQTLSDALALLNEDIQKGLPAARKAAEENSDRGALRSLVWCEKVSMMQKALIERFLKEGAAMFENNHIYVCDICGFIYIGTQKPDVCPVCKVPGYRIDRVERRERNAGF